MDTNERLHTEWLGMAQPEGLVVTTAALKAAEANITWPVIELQATLRELAGERKHIADLRGFLRDILDWGGEQLVSGAELPHSLRVHLDGGEWLVPTFALRSIDEPETFVLLVEETHRKELDAASDDKRWSATPHQRFERLLRETGVPMGLLSNGRDFRLVYAPKGESAGWVTFRLAEMLSVDGRPLLGAMHMLLNERRILSLEDKKRLGALLAASREYQNTVSNKLREQILAALRELLGGFERADRIAEGAILGDVRRDHRQEIYTGLVTVLMRMVFVLYAEERGLLPMESDLYASGYSLSRLHALLTEDRNRYGDTIDDRYGAWGRVITLFRLLHDGVRAADGLSLPPRKGSFFDPDAFPFLEGRPRGAVRQAGEILDLPRVSDGVVHRVLDRLLVLDGERLQYKGLDVEQIGSVYEGLMGFEIEVAEGDSLCLMPEHVVVDLESLVRLSGAERVKEIKARANLDLKDKAGAEVKNASSVEALAAALGKRVSPRQPGILAKGSLYLQPGEERRRTGSHYTPRSLTLPIVETTLRPVLERLGKEVRPEGILDLKICDPAMGSGAFLVEACRQLADKLVDAWRRTGTMPELPRDEDPVLHARRLIAQKCIYGVDKNPLAVDLARLSMWLVTFAKEHPFTFVDHSLRHGDSLVGLSKEQIASLSLDVSKGKQIETVRAVVSEKVKEAEALRARIHAMGDPPENDELRELWEAANEALGTVRMLGDLVVAAYFAEGSDKARKKAIEDVGVKVGVWLATGQFDAELRGMVAGLREGERAVPAFHWEIEFPEVFGRGNPGFDCFVGNPPFAGKNTIGASSGAMYIEWLVLSAAGSNGKSDLVGYFFRRAFELTRDRGTMGMIATNTLSQGDTRASSLTPILLNGGSIYAARRRVTWPHAAAVIVSIVHIIKRAVPVDCNLDGKVVGRISAFLFDGQNDTDPARLVINENKSFQGSNISGKGFTFDDQTDGASPVARMREVIAANPASQDRIFPYIGGEELNSSPAQSPHRWVIRFGRLGEEECRDKWPGLMAIVEALVKPVREAGPRNPQADYLRARWWHWHTERPSLYEAMESRKLVLANSQVSAHLAFAAQPTDRVFGHTLNIFVLPIERGFAILQSRVHECWARFFGSSMKDDLRYTPSDCFETFPFPPNYEQNPTLESIGREYYGFRAALMIENNEGLTKTYNRFHNPDERSPQIKKLRDLHAQMDRAVLDAYGWTDIQPVYDFRPQLDESIRFTWGEDTRDEVLARLLELNRVIAAKEAEEAKQAEAKKPTKKGGGGKKRGKKDEATLELPMGKGGEKA
ncbi:Eco57I restriction-modification methylase domain-containing protein [Polyangium spumosum]|uniref:site-specific DNA-methyltransferase (adenine-specific) n=1 Tax=Polyangium spumosum TaxID=889282 RepID=A0A6N7PZU1_9BACT|nr:DNA methyltransferase [Polyangium spumosum]MRG96406.1 N-6 DNA methylase [Polyangium spumosum]